MNWFLRVLKKYAVFSGRARRKEYWYFTLFYIIFFIGFVVIDGVIGSLDERYGVELLSALYALAMIIPSIAVAARRLHDTNRSGWWLLLGLIPIIGLVLIVFLLQDSQPGENQYGPNPKANAA